MSFYVRGSDDEDSLLIVIRGFTGRLTLDVPSATLPWRDLRLVEKWGRRREPYGCCDVKDPLAGLQVTANGPEVEDRTGIRGAEAVTVSRGIATVAFTTDAPMFIPCLRVAEGAAAPAAVRVATLRRTEGEAAVHVAQLSGGRRTGGVMLTIARQGQKR